MVARFNSAIIARTKVCFVMTNAASRVTISYADSFALDSRQLPENERKKGRERREIERGAGKRKKSRLLCVWLNRAEMRDTNVRAQ